MISHNYSNIQRVDWQSLIIAIKQIEMSEVIRGFADMELKQRGRKLFGVCPFHQDQDPSLMIDDEKGRAVCFGCGWSGDQIAFTCTALNVPFKVGVEAICRRFGIPFGGMTTEEYLRSKTIIQEAEREKALRQAFHQEAERIYQNLAAMYRAIESNPRQSLGLEHISGILEMIMDELAERDINRRIDAMRYVKAWLLS